MCSVYGFDWFTNFHHPVQAVVVEAAAKVYLTGSCLFMQKAGDGDASAKTEELSRLWEAWQERYGFFQRLVKGCAARAPPASGLKQLAASMLPGQSANSM